MNVNYPPPAPTQGKLTPYSLHRPHGANTLPDIYGCWNPNNSFKSPGAPRTVMAVIYEITSELLSYYSQIVNGRLLLFSWSDSHSHAGEIFSMPPSERQALHFRLCHLWIWVSS